MSVKSSSYLETEKLKAKIDNIKSDSASQLQAMGDQIYQTWKENGTVDQAYIRELCGKVQENEEELAFYEAKIEEVESEKNKILNVFEERLDFLELYVVQYISRLAIEYIVFNLAILQIVL